jgi:polyphosphate kinase
LTAVGNRAGVEYVMGFCTKEEHRRFLDLCPQVEKVVVKNGIQLIEGLRNGQVTAP